MSDVFMDLAADAVPFRDGKAHQGMAVGAQNILAKCSEPLSKVYSQRPFGFQVYVKSALMSQKKPKKLLK